MRKFFLLSLLLFVLACGGEKDTGDDQTRAFAKKTPHPLNYENASLLLTDMKAFSESVRALKQDRLKKIDSRYQDVIFQTEQSPLFLNVYPDPTSKSIIFLLVPKDPQTGANYLLKYDKKLPVTDNDTLELQIRTQNPEQPFQCRLPVENPPDYMKQRSGHQYSVRYVMKKQFIQSGTYDFDALTVESYRTRGYPFIVFDLVEAEIKDVTANLTASCK